VAHAFTHADVIVVDGSRTGCRLFPGKGGCARSCITGDNYLAAQQKMH
jgi:hypothetical protein